MRRSFRPVFAFTLLLPGVYGLVCACSLDLDESLIPSGVDAASGDVHSFGGSGGSGWVDAPTLDGPGDGASDGASDANLGSDASDAAGEGAAPLGVDCAATTCDPGSYCCFDSNAGGVCAGAPSSCSSYAIACDSTADCSAGELCCLIIASATVGCATDCALVGTSPIQFCKLDNECANSVCGPPPPVLANLLPPGYKTCG